MVTIFLIYKMFFRLSVFLEVRYATQFELIRFIIQTAFSYFFINLFVNFYKFIDTIKDNFNYIEIMSLFAAQNRLGIILVLTFAVFNRLVVRRKEGILLLIALFINIILFLFGL